MANFRKILVALDFSPQAELALVTAADLARRCSASLSAVIVYEPLAWQVPEGTWKLTSEQERRLIAAYEARLAEAERQTRDRGVTVATKLLQGSIAAEIVGEASAEGCDLIVVGTHGRGKVSRFLLGSVAERVLRTAPCAVLVVRAPVAAEVRETSAAS